MLFLLGGKLCVSLFDGVVRHLRFAVFVEDTLIIIASGALQTHLAASTDIAQYISENYHLQLTLDDAAKIAYMERTHFSKRFKQLTGFGFQDYLTQTRIRAAENLLQTTDLSISEIAEHCGFSSSNYFGDAFRRWKGISPSTYRKKQAK